MIEHLEWHQHAFIDENNKVIDVLVFEEWAHNHQLLDDIRKTNGSVKIICCCQYGICCIGDEWDEENKAWIFQVSEPPLMPIDDEFVVG